MQSHKLLLDVEDEHFHLIAIYSSWEAYKMAFSLNKYLGLRLKREPADIDFFHTDYNAVYAHYSFKDPNAYHKFDLVANKFKGQPKKMITHGSLFGEADMTSRKVCLVPEYKKADFFLKISEEIPHKEWVQILARIGQIPGIQAAHAIDVDNLKSKQNLIFE